MTHRALVSILALASASTLVACAASAPIDGAGGGEASASDDLSPTTSKAELLANDTSASSLFTDRYTPAARFHGSTSPVSNGDALPGSTDAKSLLVGSVSKVSVHTLVGSLPVYAEAQSWFCYGGKNPLSSSADGDQCGSHIDIGVDANSTAHVKKEVADMRSRGLDGVIVDWDGQAAGLGVIDQKATGPALNTGAIRLFKEQAEASNGAFHFAVCEDEGIKDCAAKSGCDVTQALVSDLAFLATNFFDSPAYVHQGGRPVLFFFSEDTWVAKYGKSIDWSYVRAHAPKNPLFVFENAGGFGHAESDGAYAWLHTQAIGSYPGSDPFGTEGFLPYFYQQVASHPTKIAWASAYKGFDDGVVNGWGGGRRYTGQQCGKTFLDTMAAAKAHASAVDGLQIPTWDDYEEGSEVETGIDNHLAIHASLTGTKLSWSLAPESGAPADCTEAIAQGFDLGATVHHYAVYASSDGQGLALVADQIPASARSIDLAGEIPAGSTELVVYAVGQPMIHDHLSNAVTVTASGTTSSSASSGSGGGGDGCTGAPVVLEPTVSENVGPAIRLRVSAPECIEDMIVYLDYKNVLKVHGSSIDQWVPVSMGPHRLSVNGWAGTATAHVSKPVQFVRTY